MIAYISSNPIWVNYKNILKFDTGLEKKILLCEILK